MVCRLFPAKSSEKHCHVSDNLSKTGVNFGATKRLVEKKHIRYLKPLTSLVLPLAIVRSSTNSMTTHNEKQNDPYKQFDNRNKTNTCKEAELPTKV